MRFSRHVCAPAELAYLQAALEGGPVCGDGPFCERAAALLRGLCGGAPVLLAPSGTAALELAALLLQVAPGDEVLMPSFTFSSTANAFALRGARLRFVDVDPGTWSMEAEQVGAALGPQTRFVVAVPYGGVQRDLPGLQRLCEAHGVPLIVDAAHALFASASGRPVASFGRLATLSFHATKNVSCGEGGALVVNDPELLDDALILREKGTDRTLFLRGQVDRYTWRAVGGSYVLSDLAAAVLVAQLEHAEQLQARRHAVWTTYAEALAPHAVRLDYRLQEIPAGCEHPAHAFGLVLAPSRDREALLHRLAAAGVPAVSHFEPLHRAPAHAGDEQLLVTDAVAGGLFRLPLHAGLSIDDAAAVVDRLLRALGATDSGRHP